MEQVERAMAHSVNFEMLLAGIQHLRHNLNISLVQCFCSIGAYIPLMVVHLLDSIDQLYQLDELLSRNETNLVLM